MAEARKPLVDWYRTPIDTALFKRLHERSDVKGFLQSAGYLGTLVATGTLAYWSWRHWPWYATVLLTFLHGMVAAFFPNAMHELGHGTVFKTKALNTFFLKIFSFLGWINYEAFNASHQRHHRYTLHPPDDQEVVLPTKIPLKSFLENGFIQWKGPWWNIKWQWHFIRHDFKSDWDKTCFPEGDKELRAEVRKWGLILLIGHGLITAVSLAFGQWMIPILVSFAPFYGGWLFFLCNNTQHTGLTDNVDDFRLCCRSIHLNPVVQFLYWHMNYHTEHHMYAAVPCYNLGKLYRAIQHDMPPRHGLVGAWQEITDIQRKQAADPKYIFLAPVPSRG